MRNSAYPVDPGARRVSLRTQLRARRRRRRVLPARRAVQPDAAAVGVAAARAAHGGDELGGPRQRGGAAGRPGPRDGAPAGLPGVRDAPVRARHDV